LTLNSPPTMPLGAAQVAQQNVFII